MKITNKVYNVAVKYLDKGYVESLSKMRITSDLSNMGVEVKPWIDEKTIKDLAIVLSSRVLESSGRI